MSEIFLLIVLVIAIVMLYYFGVLPYNEKRLIRFIRWRNKNMGIQTKITPSQLKVYKANIPRGILIAILLFLGLLAFLWLKVNSY